MRPIGLITVVLAVLAGGGLASSAQAATLNVAANGVDGPTCGAAATPCRTIGQAVLNADEGDRILVGPGVYGDLNEDDDLADDGEEEAGDPACDCMLQITKRLTFESSAGAAMTIIRGTTTLIAVSLEASGIIFGAHDRGFTIIARAGRAENPRGRRRRPGHRQRGQRPRRRGGTPDPGRLCRHQGQRLQRPE